MTQEKDKEDGENKENLVVIRVRGLTNINRNIDLTLKQLRLYKKNYCVIVPNNKSYQGMVTKVKDYVAWGNLNEETQRLLIDKKSEEYKGRINDKKEKIKYNRFSEVNGKKIKKYFRLNSPKKGYGRKGVKIPFSKGGALGYRAEKINELIKRMI